MRFSPPLQVLERGPGGEVSESPEINTDNPTPALRAIAVHRERASHAYFLPLLEFGEGVGGWGKRRAYPYSFVKSHLWNLSFG